MRRTIVFLTAPRPGLVKTLLAASLDADAASAIYRVLVEHTLNRLAACPDVELRHAPDDAGPDVHAWLRKGWRAAPQGQGDSDSARGRAVRDAFAAGATRVVLLEVDFPELNCADVESAFDALHIHDLVLGPADDGGCWLIGLRNSQPAVIEAIPSCADRPLIPIVRSAEAAGLAVHQLRHLHRIDTLEEWRAWLRERPL